ncbi:MAG: adenylosuccinate lyase [Patescibacteria group bacterium]
MRPITELTAISPLDGRYRERVAELAPYVSEYSLIKTRVEIEAKYLVALSDVGLVRRLTKSERKKLESIAFDFDLKEAKRVKEIEEETRHDVKAMERAFRALVASTSLADVIEMIHFGLTSEDVNNLAYRLMLKRATEDVCIPTLDGFIEGLIERADKFKATPMLARTHGQGAVPTTVGKELIVFATRLNTQVRKLERQQLTGKLTGAVGNFNALEFAAADIDWIKLSHDFVKNLGFAPNLVTTQINPYEDIIEYFQTYQRVNSIIIDFDQDMWRYISDDWFIQEVRRGEVGSSTMPQKVNPIDFENSEGNLTIANGVLETLSRKLAVSRLQRDLSDSTAIRNIGTVLGYSLVGYKSVIAGLSRIRPNPEQIEAALNEDWTILSEGVQTLLRKAGVEDPYSMVSPLTRGVHIGKDQWQQWIEHLPVTGDQKEQLNKLSPETYVGLAAHLTERAIKEINPRYRSGLFSSKIKSSRKRKK